MVNEPTLPGSPSRTAIFAPAGNDAGASPHCTSLKVTTLCSLFVAVAAAADLVDDFASFADLSAPTTIKLETATTAAMRTAIFFIFMSQLHQNFRRFGQSYFLSDLGGHASTRNESSMSIFGQRSLVTP